MMLGFSRSLGHPEAQLRSNYLLGLALLNLKQEQLITLHLKYLDALRRLLKPSSQTLIKEIDWHWLLGLIEKLERNPLQIRVPEYNLKALPLERALCLVLEQVQSHLETCLLTAKTASQDTSPYATLYPPPDALNTQLREGMLALHEQIRGIYFLGNEDLINLLLPREILSTEVHQVLHQWKSAIEAKQLLPLSHYLPNRQQSKTADCFGIPRRNPQPLCFTYSDSLGEVKEADFDETDEAEELVFSPSAMADKLRALAKARSASS